MLEMTGITERLFGVGVLHGVDLDARRGAEPRRGVARPAAPAIAGKGAL